MKTVRVTIDAASAGGLTLGRIDPARVDATTEESIAAQRAADESEARLDAAGTHAGSERALVSARSSLRGVLMFLSRPSAIGNKANAPRPVRQRPCSKCWTRHPS
jgi:hypothetical protein